MNASRPLNIVHTESSGGWGGQELRTINELWGLRQRGHHPLLICVKDSPVHLAATERGLECKTLPIGPKRPRGMLAMRQFFASTAIDVIVTHSSSDSWQAAIACALMHRPPPLVRTRHITTEVGNNWASRWLYKTATTHVISAGEVVRQQLMQAPGIAGEDISAIATGIDTALFVPGDRRQAREELGLAPGGTYPGILAYLRDSKGHEYLFRAIAQLSIPGLQLLVVGDGGSRASLESLAQELGITDQILFAGQQNNPVRWLQAMDVMVLPSVFGEGVPQAISQAMACALPIIATPTGGIPEVVFEGKTGLLVPPEEVDGLEQALTALLADPARAIELGHNGHDFAIKNLGLDTMLDRLEAVYQQVVTSYSA